MLSALELKKKATVHYKFSYLFITKYILSAFLLLFATLVSADGINGADTAWVLTSTALVLLMTLPGLALFYGGLVRSKNVLSVLAQCFAITAVVSILWFAFGYSLSFSEG